MFRPVHLDKQVVGYQYESETALYFFGNRFCDRLALPRLFPEFSFSFLKQVHGVHIVKINNANDHSSQPVADGQFTEQRNLALVIQTADCLPVMMEGPEGILALHAGWRGVAQNIISQAAHFLSPAQLVVLGPHIGAQSFEIGLDALELLKSGCPKDFDVQWCVRAGTTEGKFLFELKRLAEAQLQITFSNLEPDVVLELKRDTLADGEFFSFRREKEKAGRQLSFVVLK